MPLDNSDHTKFNMGTLISFRNKERDKTLSIGAYNGQIQFVLGDGKYQPGVKPRSVYCNIHMAGVLKDNIRNILDHPEPGKKFTLIYNGIWNAEVKRRELSFTCTIGITDAATCYIGIKHVNNADKSVWNGLFELSGDPYLEVAGSYDDLKSKSFATLKLIYDLLNACYFQTSALFTRNYLAQRPTDNKSSSTASTSPSDVIEY